MAHAQKLIPIEQFLSDAAASTGIARAAGKPAIVPERRPEVASSPRPNFVSPFAADSARKGGTKMSAEAAPVAMVVGSGNGSSPVVMGAAVAEARESIHEVLKAPPIVEVAPLTVIADPGSSDEQLRHAVLGTLADGGHRMLASMLESGEWKLEGNDLVITVPSSAAVIDMSLGADAKKLAIASASGVLGRTVKLKVMSGGAEQMVAVKPVSSNGGGRSRAEQDPIVRRMKEKFGAEIRTIIDYREKR